MSLKKNATVVVTRRTGQKSTGKITNVDKTSRGDWYDVKLAEGGTFRARAAQLTVKS